MTDSPVLVLVVIALGLFVLVGGLIWFLRSSPRPTIDADMAPDERRRLRESQSPPINRHAAGSDSGQNLGF